MKKLKKFLSNLNGLLHKNNVLKILSVFLAIFVWFYILYIVNPVNEVVFDKVEVSLAYEGSVPERNGYMYLMTDTNLTVSVTVSGSRSELLNLSKEDIKASLNMDSVISAGTYNIGVSVNTGNKNFTVTDVYPKNFTIEFAEQATRTVPVELQATGALPEGYVIESTSFSPTEITVSGPANTIAEISKAYLTVPLTNMKENISGSYDISLVNAAGENIDRKYLTLSDLTIQADLSVKYRKTMETSVEVINSSGGNESQYITVTLDTNSIQALGTEGLLSGIDAFSVGTVDTSQFTKSGTVALTIPTLEGATFNKEQVTATITIAPDTATKTLRFSNADITCINVPTGKVARVTNSAVNITIRAKAGDLGKLNTTNLKCLVDMSQANEDGTYPILVTTASGIGFGVVGGPYGVEVNVQ